MTVATRLLDVEDPLLEHWLTTVGAVFKDRPSQVAEAVAARRVRMAGTRIRAVTAPADPLRQPDGDLDEVVACFQSWDGDLTVPGGSARVDLVSAVTVLPTHRRQGALSALMRQDLSEAKANGTCAAVLIASEGGIYGRFGFGPATAAAGYRVDVRRVRLRPDLPPPSGRVAVVPVASLREVAPQVFQRARRSGAVDRDRFWWDHMCCVELFPGSERKPPFAVVHRDASGEVDGYAWYRPKEEHGQGHLARTTFGTATVEDLQATTDEAYRDLWRYLLALDLVDEVLWDDAAVDEPLAWLLTDPRALRLTTRDDFLWARLLDPAAALNARRYESGAGRLVFEVDDPFGWAAGVYTLTVSDDREGRAELTPDAQVQVRVDVDVLSGLWLGGDGTTGGLRGAALAGRARDLQPGSLDRLSRLLRTHRQPSCDTWF
jgi:predicted acetyltransferase